MASKNLPIVDWLQIESTAPGKFIISGEYSVVYEKQAIAAAIDLKTQVTIKPNKDAKVRLKLTNLDSVREWPTSSLTTCRLVAKYSECLDYNDSMATVLNHLLHSRYVVSKETEQKDPSPEEQDKQSSGEPVPTDTTPANQADTKKVSKDQDKKADDAAIAFLLLYIGLGDSYCSSARPPIDVEVRSDVPVGSGLGSSSAYSVALCGALMRVFRVAAEKYIISNWAFNIDKFFHGKPSGVDNNVVAHGGCILFQNGKIRAQEVHHKHPIRVLLVDTRVSRSTRALSENVNLQLKENTRFVNELFNTINELTTQIWRQINLSTFKPADIAEYLQMNQINLDALGVGHEKLTHITTLARAHNLVAKQTGAGGGGTAFVLYDESEDSKVNIQTLRRELETSGYLVRDHSIDYDGLVVKVAHDPDKEFPAHGKMKF